MTARLVECGIPAKDIQKMLLRTMAKGRTVLVVRHKHLRFFYHSPMQIGCVLSNLPRIWKEWGIERDIEKGA